MDIPGNEEADKLAKEATTLTGSLDPTHTFALWKSKATILHEWMKTWRNQPICGLYGQANHLKLSLKPTKHFKDLENKREIFERLVQCRTGHGYFGEYYEHFVPTENNACPCGGTCQTREHILYRSGYEEPISGVRLLMEVMKHH